MTSEFIIVFCTCDNETTATAIAEHIVSQKLAACVNIMPQIKSIYQWQGKIERDSETLLLIKTTKVNFTALEQAINNLHNYDVPEIIAVDINHGSKPYLNWLKTTLKGE